MRTGAHAPHEEKNGHVEVSPVYAVLENPSMIDFPGHLCGVFFVSGCNFGCGFCHNATLMGGRRPGLSWERLERLCNGFREQWTDAACITGGEPTLADDLPALIDFLRRFGFLIKLDSNGSCPDMLRKVLPRIDYIAMDIKAGLSGYPALTGFSETDRIRESVRLIMGSGIAYEFRTTLIPSFHTDEQLLEMAELVRGAECFCLQPFIPQDHLPDEPLRTEARTTPQRLREAGEIFRPFVKQVKIRGL